MPSWLNRLTGGRKSCPPKEIGRTADAGHADLAGDPNWSRRGFASLAHEGFAKNPVVYRCVRMIAEAATACRWPSARTARRLTDHPALTLLAGPTRGDSGTELFECLYAYLQTAGNAYLQAAMVDGEVKGAVRAAARPHAGGARPRRLCQSPTTTPPAARPRASTSWRARSPKSCT